MKIVILEFIDEFKQFLKFTQKNNYKPEDFCIIAIEPRLQAYIKNCGLKYKTTLGYFNNDSHKKILVETEKIMKYIRENFHFEDNNKLHNCYESDFTLYFRFYLNHLFKILEVLENVYKEDRTCEIFASIQAGFMVDCPMITDQERYLGHLAKSFAETKNLKFVNFVKNKSYNESGNKSKIRFKIPEKFITRMFLLFLVNKKVIIVPRRGREFKRLVHSICLRDRKTIFLGIDYTESFFKVIIYNILAFTKFIFKIKSYQYYALNLSFIHKENNIKDEAKKLMKCIDTIMCTENKNLYTYNGVNYYNLVKKKVDAGLKKHMTHILSQSYNIEYIFKKLNKVVIISYYSHGVMAIVSEFSRKTGKKSLFISHGSHPTPINYYHEIELSNLCRSFMLSDYTHIALCTPVQEAHLHYFKKKYEWVRNSEIKTGNIVFSDLKGSKKISYKNNLGFSPEEIIITYAVTTKARQGERYYFLETLDEFFASLSDIVKSIDKIKNIKLIVRIHPGFYLSDKEIKTLLPVSDKFIIHRKGSFPEVLAATDILISYSSTCIDEALINKIPVILYDKWKRYNHFQTGVYRNDESLDIFPVCYVDEQSNLDRALQYMMKKNRSVLKKDINVDTYCYRDDYHKNLYTFLEQTLI